MCTGTCCTPPGPCPLTLVEHVTPRGAEEEPSCSHSESLPRTHTTLPRSNASQRCGAAIGEAWRGAGGQGSLCARTELGEMWGRGGVDDAGRRERRLRKDGAGGWRLAAAASPLPEA